MKNNPITNLVNLFFNQSPKETNTNNNMKSIMTDDKYYSENDPIEVLSLNSQIEFILKGRKIDTVGKLYKCKRKRLNKIKFIGPKSLKYLMRVKREIHINKLDSDDNGQKQHLNENDKLSKQEKTSQNLSYIDLSNIDLLPSISRDDDISALGLPTRLENSLRNVALFTIGDFYDYNDEALFKVRNIGYKTYPYLLKIKKELESKFDLKAPEKPEREDKNKDKLRDDNPEETLEKLLNKVNLSGGDPIETLGLPTRVENALKAAGIKTLNLLFSLSDKEIIEGKNLGYKSLELIKYYKNSIEKGVVSGINDEELVDLTLNRCRDDRDKTIIIKRYGFYTGERDTLEEIGKSLNITRERVRQIQNKMLSRMRHPSTKSRERLKELMIKACFDNGGMITDREADKLIPPLIRNSSIDGSSFLDLLADIGWIQKHGAGDVFFYSPNSTDYVLSELMEKIISVLKVAKQLLSLDEVLERLYYTGDKNSIMRDIVAKCCVSDPRIEQAGEKYTLYSIPGHKQDKWAHYMSKVLEQSGEPLHFTEIAGRVNDLISSSDQKIEQRRVHAILIQNHQFAHTGTWGMYGLTKWGLRKESTLDLAEEYIKKAGFPVHLDQIYNYVSKYKYTKPNNIASILNNDRFIKMERGMYWLKNVKTN